METGQVFTAGNLAESVIQMGQLEEKQEQEQQEEEVYLWCNRR